MGNKMGVPPQHLYCTPLQAPHCLLDPALCPDPREGQTAPASSSQTFRYFCPVRIWKILFTQRQLSSRRMSGARSAERGAF